MIGERGHGLIFILSQPRAGSTLLQRMLGAHSQVHTVQEPAIALYPLRGLRALRDAAVSESEPPHLFVRSFLQELPEGDETYVAGLRKMLCTLYKSVLATSDARFFLDKTPSYFDVIPELGRVFPEAHYIILFRNPLAVLSSVLDSWVRGEWLGVAHARSHLLEAPVLLSAGRDLLGVQAHTVHYEALVHMPEETMRTVCHHLDLDYASDLIEYGRAGLPYWRHGDQKSVYRYTRPEPTQADKWVGRLDHPQVWRLSHDYLQTLGPQVVCGMGYDFDELRDIVMTHAPPRPQRWLTFPMEWLMRSRPAERTWWERRLVWFVRRLRRARG